MKGKTYETADEFIAALHKSREAYQKKIASKSVSSTNQGEKTHG